MLPEIANGLPDGPSLVLVVDEDAFAARGQHADAETLQVGAADVVGRFPGFEGLDAVLAEADIGHRFSSCCLLQAGGKQLHFCPPTSDCTRKKRL